MTEFYCVSCAEPRDKGDGYCEVCGTELAPLRYCDECGVAAMHHGSFCRECGARLPEPQKSRPVEPIPRPARPRPTPRPQPATRAQPESARTAPAPLATRPQAAPVLMKAEPPAPVNAALATMGGVAGTAGVVVAAFNPAAGIMLIMLMVLLASRHTNRAAAAAMNGLIDQLWERPVLRRRLLGE